MQLQTLQELFEHEISDLYSAETQLVTALPKLAQAASNGELRDAFEHHLQETRDHVIGKRIDAEHPEGKPGIRGGRQPAPERHGDLRPQPPRALEHDEVVG